MQTDESPRPEVSKGLFPGHASLPEERASISCSRNEEVLLSLGEETFQREGPLTGKE